MIDPKFQTIPLDRAVLCTDCDTVSDTCFERCPYCGSEHTLLSLARVLKQNPKMGRIMFINSGVSA